MKLDGVLFFPVTPFTDTGELAIPVLAEHVKTGLAAGPGGVFVGCGTGEFNALDPGELEQVARTAVDAVGGQVPVFAGVGGALPLAKEFARAAKRAGADGLLLLPPYLVACPQEGLVRYVETVAAATDLPLIVYQRNNAVFTSASVLELARLPTVVGFKDGLGDLDRLREIVLAARSDVDKPFQFFNGMPTAEVSVPAYREIGVELYSSAVFCFAPEISLAFYEAVRAEDGETVERLLDGFYRPLVALRDAVPGYAISLVKAGVRLRGLDVGPVRPPLVDPGPDHLGRLREILDNGLALLRS
jgi:5-dehydro-4-deoxyglucarate dehydratase